MVRLKSDSLTVAHHIAQAMQSGEATSPIAPVINRAGDCIDPVTVELIGKPITDHPRKFYAEWSRNADVMVRCRRCQACLDYRSRLWAARALNELELWPRSWFGTLTLSPDQQFRFALEARRRSRARASVDFEALTPDEKFKELVQAISPEITKFLKRVRAQSGARLRYLLVSEAHKSGLPHFHLLVHETCAPVRKRLLQGQWTLGFSHWRLVDLAEGKQAGFYVTKYLAKSVLTRVRASVKYGEPPNHPVSMLGALQGAPSLERL